MTDTTSPAPDGELAWLVFTPFPTGSGSVALFAPEQFEEARANAEQRGGLLLHAGVVTDFRRAG